MANILEGSVRRAGQPHPRDRAVDHRLRRQPLWSERYDREMADVFAVQDEISAAIVEALEVKLGRPVRRAVKRKTARQSRSLSAYLEGRYYCTR